jgi:hypothetical protein
MKPDWGLIVAVERNQTGSNIHKLNNLLHQYVSEGERELFRWLREQFADWMVLAW